MTPFPGGPGRRDEDARSALARRRRRRRIRMVFAWCLLALFTAGALGVASMGGERGVDWLRAHTTWFEVRAVDVGDTAWMAPWEVVDACGVIPGDDLMAVDPEAVALRLERHPRIARARVARTWRRSIRLDIVENPPAAVVVAERPMEIAADGTLLGDPSPLPDWPVPRGEARSARGLELPLLTGVVLDGAGPGTVLEHEGVRQALEFLDRLRVYRSDGSRWLSEIWAQRPGELVVTTLVDGVEIRVGDGRLSRRKLSAVHAVLEELRGTGEEVDYVDARFRNQVIVKAG